MRPSSVVVLLVVLVIVAACGYYVHQYFDQAKNLPKDESGTDEWKVAVNQARHLRYGELPACWFLLPTISFALAGLKAPTRISWLRNAVAILVTFAVVFLVTTALMHGALAEKNASYVLPPSAIWDAIWFAASSLFVMSVILFTIERIYVNRKVAPHA
jgi:hypothetical protein